MSSCKHAEEIGCEDAICFDCLMREEFQKRDKRIAELVLELASETGKRMEMVAVCHGQECPEMAALKRELENARKQLTMFRVASILPFPCAPDADTVYDGTHFCLFCAAEYDCEQEGPDAMQHSIGCPFSMAATGGEVKKRCSLCGGTRWVRGDVLDGYVKIPCIGCNIDGAAQDGEVLINPHR